MRWPWQRAPDIKLDQPANVFWIARDPERRSFESVTDAVRFVMDDLPGTARPSSWITVDDKMLTVDEIEKLDRKRWRVKSS
jgi:hypothetical protein